MNRGKASIFLLWVILSFAISPVSNCIVSAEAHGNDLPTIIEMEIEDGTTIVQSTTIFGTIANEVAPNSISWELRDSSGSRLFVDLSEDLTLLQSSDSWNIWQFEIVLEPTSIGTCSCVLIVNSENNETDLKMLALSIFISTSSDPQPPTILIHNEIDGIWASGAAVISGITSTQNREPPDILYEIRESTNVRCSHSYDDFDNFIDMSSESVWSNGIFELSVELTDHDDGWHDLYIVAEDETSGKVAYDCSSIRVDNSAPQVFIDSPDEISEGYDGIHFDGTGTNDGDWGISGLIYVWSITKINQNSRENMFVISGPEKRTISFDTNESGVFEVTLRVTDNARNSDSVTKSFIVKNIEPVARLLIDGTPIYDGETFRLAEESTVIIDATTSSDTENDINSLRFVWRVNNVPIYEGGTREFGWPNDASEDFILTLEVIDDDSISSTISVLIRGENVPVSSFLPVIILFVSAIFFTYSVIRFRGDDEESDIPKWI